jgi:hypothetical protein
MASVSGGDKILQVLGQLGDRLGKATEVRVGFLEDATYPDGTPVAMVAALNNFGAPEAGIPARPFFTRMVADKSPGWSDDFGKAMKGAENDTQKALDIMGTHIADQLRDAVADPPGPANSPVTDLLKQRFPMGGQTFGDVQQARRDVAAGQTAPAGKPLVWTGVMASKIDKEVR